MGQLRGINVLSGHPGGGGRRKSGEPRSEKKPGKEYFERELRVLVKFSKMLTHMTFKEKHTD